MDLQEMNRTVIEEFHSNAGEVGGNFAGMPLLLLNTVGAKSGKAYTKPLAYLTDGDRYVIFASFAGSDQHPPWYYNLLATPDVEIEVGTKRIKAKAAVAAEPERTALYAKIAAAIPVFGDYQAKAGRTIPVFILTPA
jgi:deazaflavin-dependent oxidoreductase (nitroreductase family)